MTKPNALYKKLKARKKLKASIKSWINFEKTFMG